MISEPIKADASGAVTLPAELCRTAGAELVAEVEAGRIVVAACRPSLAERIAARVAALPPESLALLPADGASQHAHYIYGTPKRPE